MEFDPEAWSTRDYVYIFLAYYGPPPWGCYFCGNPVTSIKRAREDSGDVHHLDHNHDNHDPYNLVIGHRRCHLQYHKVGVGFPGRKSPGPLDIEHRTAIGNGVRGVTHTEQARANMAAGAKRRYQSAEERAKAGQHFAGVPKSEIHRQKLAEAQKVRSQCPGCGSYYNKTWMVRHKCSGREAVTEGGE